jgi:hypothetical protein
MTRWSVAVGVLGVCETWAVVAYRGRGRSDPGSERAGVANDFGERMAKMETLIARGALPRVEAEETWTLLRDLEGWQIVQHRREL